MGVRTKTLILVLFVGAVAGVYTLSVNNENLFKGQILDTPAEVTVEEKLPDLSAKVEIINPTTENEDLKTSITIENIGEGQVISGQTFIYKLYINDIEVISNSDSYSALLPGDSFNFEYPISKAIYQYPDSGKIKFILDTENSVKELNEDNNAVEVNYAL